MISIRGENGQANLMILEVESRPHLNVGPYFKFSLSPNVLKTSPKPKIYGLTALDYMKLKGILRLYQVRGILLCKLA